jgi:hypothetical protein
LPSGILVANTQQASATGTLGVDGHVQLLHRSSRNVVVADPHAEREGYFFPSLDPSCPEVYRINS